MISLQLKGNFVFIIFLTCQIGFSQTNLELDTSKNEIIRLGYFELPSTLFAGQKSSLEEKDFNQGIITAPEQLFQGKIAGVQTAHNNGMRNGPMTTIMRGLSSLSALNPLFVIDGQIIQGDEISQFTNNSFQLGANPLDFLNPDDIEKIEFLKDAASASFGIRGANGVILITTKKGHSKSPLFNFKTSIGISNLANGYDLLSANEFIGLNPNFNKNGDTDWRNEVFKRGVSQNHHFSFAQGSENANLRISFNQMTNNGIVENLNLKRYNLSAIAEKNFLDNKLKVGFNASYAFTDDNKPRWDLLRSIVRSNPTFPVFLPNSSEYNYYAQFGVYNPIAMPKNYIDKTQSNRVLGNGFINYKIKNGLNIKSRFNLDYSNSEQKIAITDKFININNSGSYLNNRIIRVHQNADLGIDYNTKWRDFSFFSAVGFSAQQLQFINYSKERNGFNKFSLDEILNHAKSNQIESIFDINRNNLTLALNSHVSLAYKNKYFLNINNVFQKTNLLELQDPTFIMPAVLFKWNILKEFQNVPSWISELALRLNYARSSNIPYEYEQSSKLLKGQTSRLSYVNQFNLGIDISLIRNKRLSFSMDYFEKSATNLFSEYYFSQSFPISTASTFFDGNLITKGLELSVNSTVIEKRNFKWLISTNGLIVNSFLHKFVSPLNKGNTFGQGLSGTYTQRLESNQLPYQFYVRKFSGFDASGISTYKDGDFQQYIAGASPFAKELAGFYNQFIIKNVDISFLFHSVRGNYIYNNTANDAFTAISLYSGYNVTKEVLSTGESNFNAPDISSRFLERGDFTKLSNFNIGYTLNLNKRFISSLRFFANGQNLLLFSKYTGNDPEFIAWNNNFGVDYFRMPTDRIFTFGINAKL